MPRYLVFGAGAIGSIMGAKLHEIGREVVLIGRERHVESIQLRGLRIVHQENARIFSIPSSSSPLQIEPRLDDRILITLKAQQTDRELAGLATRFSSVTPVVSFQNGVRNEELLATRFARTYGGLVDFSGTFLEPGIVHHTRGNLLALGLFPEGMDETGEAIAQDLEQAGFRVDRSTHIMELKWWKLVINTTNALLAILDCWVQKGHSHPAYYPLVADVMEESLQILTAAGIKTQPPVGNPPLPEMIERMRRGEMAVEWELPNDQRTYPSTWQDLKLKRGSSEADLFNGEIVRLAQQRDIQAPMNQCLLKILKGKELSQEIPGGYTPSSVQRLFVGLDR
jgi:2-dehydropantoate 2-reductase